MKKKVLFKGFGIAGIIVTTYGTYRLIKKVQKETHKKTFIKRANKQILILNEDFTLLESSVDRIKSILDEGSLDENFKVVNGIATLLGCDNSKLPVLKCHLDYLDYFVEDIETLKEEIYKLKSDLQKRIIIHSDEDIEYLKSEALNEKLLVMTESLENISEEIKSLSEEEFSEEEEEEVSEPIYFEVKNFDENE